MTDARSHGATSDRPRPLPDWDGRVTARLAEAERRIGVVARATPLDLPRELAALEADFRAGRPREPRFHYEPAPPSELEGELLRLAELLAREEHPLAALYRDRAAELALEHRMTTRVGTADFFRLARERCRVPPDLADAADEVASRWLDEATAPDAATTELVRSDDERDPRSLVSRLTAEIGARRLGVRLATTDRIAALAATGEGLVVVARDRMLRIEDVERTVVHELEGHVAPRLRSHSLAPGLFRVGTARGSDDQEGRALLLEERHGHLGERRRRELARRHMAARAVEGGRDFVETVASLRERGAELPEALRLAARAHRGGGLAREIVYLPAYLAVKRALLDRPNLDETLASGRIALRHAELVRPYARPT